MSARESAAIGDEGQAPDHTPAQIMAGISAALKASDMEAAAGLVRYLATKDPVSAELIVAAVDLLSQEEDRDDRA